MPSHPVICESVFGSAFERGPDAQLLVDDERRPVAADSSAAALLEIPAEQVLGTRIDDLASERGGADPAVDGSARLT